MNVGLIGREGEEAAGPAFLLGRRRANIDEARFEDGAHLALDLVYFFSGVAIEREIQTHFENALLRLLKRIAEFFKVGIGGVEHRAAHQSFFFTRRYLALHFGDLFLEFTEHLIRIHGVYEYGNIDDLVHVDDGCEPARGKEARVRDDEEGSGYLFTEIELSGIDTKRVRRDDVL